MNDSRNVKKTHPSTRAVRASAWLLFALLVTGVSALLLWGTDFPLGVPGEWTWPRIPFSAETVYGWLFTAPVALIYLVFVAWGGRAIARCNRPQITLWLVGLAVAGFCWLFTVQAAVPGIAGLSKSPFVLYYPGSSGYFWQARHEVTGTGEFLAGYEDQMAEQDYLHIGTHPPGLTLVFRGLLLTLDHSPGLVNAILATQPKSVSDAARVIRDQSQATRYPFTETDRACLWLWALLTQAAAAATVFPLFLIVRRQSESTTAWFTSAMWPLVPAIAIFLPKSDVLFPFLSILTACLWWHGWKRSSLPSCVAAGFTLLAGMLLSLAFLPTAAIIALWTLIDGLIESRRDSSAINFRRLVVSVSCAAAGFLLPVLILWLSCDLNLPRVWWWNFENHALFYDHNVRTWGKWLLVNPIELMIAAGAPLALLAASGLLRGLRPRRLSAFALALCVIWGLLWISGKNMGEAARLWIILMPWLIVAAGLHSWTTTGDQHQLRPAQTNRLWLAVISLQLIACAVTVTRIDGFHFDQVQPPSGATDRVAVSDGS